MIVRKNASQERRFQLLPAIDLRGGRVVRLSQGDFDRETVYSNDPAAVAAAFVAAGARWVHVVDLDGARDGERRQMEAVMRIVAAAGTSAACEVAGGLRDEAAVEAVLAAGAARAVIGTAALTQPGFVARLVALFGTDRIVVALDVRDGMAVGQGWVPRATATAAAETLAGLADRGARRFEVTAIDRDGLLAGPDLQLLSSMVALDRGEIIASGGISSLADIAAVREIGCGGAIVGRAIYEGHLDLPGAVALASQQPAPRP
jgi:phosphoribosylformimino-5-aminoimidazole carboxamide ribotide isomerase